MLSQESFSQEKELVTYYEEISDLYQPKSLSKELTAAVARDAGSYFAAHRFNGKPIHLLRHFSNKKVVAELTYSYSGNEISEIVFKKNDDNAPSTCIVSFKGKTRHTRCFDQNNKPLSEEWYNSETTEYSLGTYDSSGTVIQTEWGSYSPRKKND